MVATEAKLPVQQKIYKYKRIIKKGLLYSFMIESVWIGLVWPCVDPFTSDEMLGADESSPFPS